MILLDNEIQDLKIKIRALSGMADFAIFNSGPKKIVTNMFYFDLEHGQVMGCKQPTIEEDEDLLGLDNWIKNLYYCPSKIPLIAGKLIVKPISSEA